MEVITPLAGHTFNTEIYDNTSTTDSISDGALTSMALFSNSWLYYRYDNLSRLTERDVGNILTEHQAYLAGSGTCTTTTLPETLQLRDFADYAKLTGRSLELFVRPTTKVATTVISAGWNIHYLW